MALRYKSSQLSHIDGLDTLNKQLEELGQATAGKALRSAVMAASLPVFKQAQASAPVGTEPHMTYKKRLVSPGFLKRSLVRKSSIRRDKSGASVVIGVRSEAFYGVQFLELGTSKIPRRPWLVPALKEKSEEFKSLFVQRLRQRIEKIKATK